jgi:hypothetical protein
MCCFVGGDQRVNKHNIILFGKVYWANIIRSGESDTQSYGDNREATEGERRKRG